MGDCAQRCDNSEATTRARLWERWLRVSCEPPSSTFVSSRAACDRRGVALAKHTNVREPESKMKRPPRV